MAKYNKILIPLLALVLLVVGGLSVYAYQKQQDYKNSKEQTEEINETPEEKYKNLIKSLSERFDKENDLNKKIEILEELNSKKEEITKVGKDIQDDFDKKVSEFKEKITKNITDDISKNNLNESDSQDSNKVRDSLKELESLKQIIENKKDILYTEEESAAVLTEIDTLISRYNNLTQETPAQTSEQSNAAEATTPQSQQNVQPAEQPRYVNPQLAPRVPNNNNVNNNSSRSNSNTTPAPTPAPEPLVPAADVSPAPSTDGNSNTNIDFSSEDE